MHHTIERLVPHRLLAAAAFTALSTLACSTTNAADYLFTASGPLATADSVSDTFNGTSHGTLASHLDLDRLAGGSFQASFRFSTTSPDTDPGAATAFYAFPGLSASLTFELFDSAGQLVHQGSNFTADIALLSDNAGGAPFTVDQVLLGVDVGNTSGIRVPSLLYSPSAEAYSGASASFFGNVSNGSNYLTDLLIPTDATTYLAFPDRVFEVYNFFGDGDVANMIEPYQFLEDRVNYRIDALSVTFVPSRRRRSFLPAPRRSLHDAGATSWVDAIGCTCFASFRRRQFTRKCGLIGGRARAESNRRPIS